MDRGVVQHPSLELPRFDGHLMIGGGSLLKGVHDGKDTSAISAGVPG